MTEARDKLEQMLWDIERDNLSGSVNIAQKTAALLVEAAHLAESGGETLGSVLPRYVDAVASAHPFMALVRTVGRSGREAGTAEDLSHTLERLLWELDNCNQRIAERMAGLFPVGGVFMTNSFSATVYSALRHLAGKGSEVRAIVVESRPAREGVQLARALGEHAIPSTLIVDAGVASFIGRADAVLVGGDAVSGGFFVNKIGTYPTVLAARSNDIPVYLLASTLKFIPERDIPEVETPRAPEEVESGSMDNVTIENIYFERVPLELVTGIVTEDGVMTASEVARRVAALG